MVIIGALLSGFIGLFFAAIVIIIPIFCCLSEGLVAPCRSGRSIRRRRCRHYLGVLVEGQWRPGCHRDGYHLAADVIRHLCGPTGEGLSGTAELPHDGKQSVFTSDHMLHRKVLHRPEQTNRVRLGRPGRKSVSLHFSVSISPVADGQWMSSRGWLSCSVTLIKSIAVLIN